jgi:hypothetical protein
MRRIDARISLLSLALLASAVSIGSVLVGCESTPAPKGPAASKFKGVLLYYPLEKGFQWSFMLRGPQQGPMDPGLLAVTKCVEFDGTVALLMTGSELSELRVASDGLVRVSSNAYLLKLPLSLGQTWKGAGGAAVEVTKVDEKVKVDAGEFEGCVVTTETFRGDEARVVTTTYCPDVGPVRLEIHQTAVAPGEIPVVAIATLRSFGPAVDLGAK